MELEDAVKERPYVLSEKSNKRFFWDFIIIIFAVLNGLSLPLEIAFNDQIFSGTSDGFGTLIKILNWITVVVFTLDIIAGFITSYINVSSGDEIFSLKMIAMNYMWNGSFIIDILSTFPIDDIYTNLFQGKSSNVERLLKVFGILKMQRIRRISKIIGNMN